MPTQNGKLDVPQTVSPMTESVADDFAELFQKVEFPVIRECGGTHRMALPSGREVSAGEEGDGELVTIYNPRGEVELSIRFTPAGPVLHFQAAAIKLQTSGELDINCGRLHLQSHGDVTEEVGGEKHTQVAGKASFEAHTIDVKSHRGNITAKANDDVCLLGERIKLNS